MSEINKLGADIQMIEEDLEKTEGLFLGDKQTGEDIIGATRSADETMETVYATLTAATDTLKELKGSFAGLSDETGNSPGIASRTKERVECITGLQAAIERVTGGYNSHTSQAIEHLTSAEVAAETSSGAGLAIERGSVTAGALVSSAMEAIVTAGEKLRQAQRINYEIAGQAGIVSERATIAAADTHSASDELAAYRNDIGV